MKQHKIKKSEVLRATNPQDVAFGFNTLAESITKELNKYAYRQNDPGVARLYVTCRQSMESWCKLAKEGLPDNPELPDLPGLIGNDYYAGMVNLAEWCQEAAKEKTLNADEELFVLTENQKKILNYLKSVSVAVANVDIESEIGLSNKTISNELRILKKYKFVDSPEGKKRRIGITSKGIDRLDSLK